MRVGAFELEGPAEGLREPHLMVALRPWIDVGMVGSSALHTLESHLGARELGRLATPGRFYDFTRYRPVRSSGGAITVPNSVLRYSRRPGKSDLIFLHALEPHLNGKEYVESILAVAQHLGVRRYLLLGAMYGRSPHTRPLALTGRATEPAVQAHLARTNVQNSTYEGPTTILVLASEQAQQRGMEMAHLLVQLPSYIRVEEDHRGQETLLRTLEGLYGFGLDLEPLAQEAALQYREMGKLVQTKPELRGLIQRLEREYDASSAPPASPAEGPPLPPEVEGFLRGLEGGPGPG